MSGGVEQNFTFSEDRIALKIPKEGINVGEWKVKPASPPTVSRHPITAHS